MDEDLTSRNMNNGEESNRDNPRDSNPNNRDSNNPRFSNPRGSNPNNSILNLRASNTKEDHNPHILKENLKEGMQDIESRGLMSHLAAKKDVVSSPSLVRSVVIWPVLADSENRTIKDSLSWKSN